MRGIGAALLAALGLVFNGGAALPRDNTGGTLVKDLGAPPGIVVPGTTALKTLAGAVGLRAVRAGFTAPGDGGGLPYDWSGSNCAAADDGAQVQPTGITGCWIADFANTRPTPLIWGAKGDGVSDDTAAVQAAMTALWTATEARPLHIARNQKYLITSALSSANRAILLSDEGPVSPYATSCPSGLSTNSDIGLLTLTGPTATVRNVCFQMGASAGARASGYALKIGGTAGTQQGHAQIVANTVVFPFDGILIGGSTTGATQTNGTLVADNLIVSPENEGIAIGRESSEASTTGTTLRDNQVACFAANTNATGIAFYDGALRYYGADSGPYGCNIGFAIKPGMVGGNRQLALGQFDGVLGDSSITAGLDIDATAAAAAAFYLKFVNGWAASTTATDTPVRIRNTGGGTVKNLIFANGIFHSGANQSTPIFDIQAGTAITISGNQIVADGGGTTTGPGIKIAAGVQDLTIAGNLLSGFNGTLATGISLPSAGLGAGIWTITGNTILATTPLAYTPNGETAIIDDNLGIQNTCPAVADAAAITFPASASCFRLDGGTTVTAIANSAWSNREVDIIAGAGKTLNAGGAPLCGATALTLAANESARLKWYTAGGCWRRL